ncbi:expressed unknown protein [Seminavis robusta]|uniref:Membrane-associated protein n=1 Tax=Seminavis robusta TaxID=568900 RepID=A0A9N8DG03_9STRA|nr:expressed unknown protein [Seminavis robusta]|eukprot:Sro123_g059630.1 n/a (148) ;mRNA; r:76856-77299
MRKRVGIPLLVLLLASLSFVWAVVAPTHRNMATEESMRNYDSSSSSSSSRSASSSSFHRATHSSSVSNEKGINRGRRTQFQARHAHVTPPRLIKPVVTSLLLMVPDDMVPRAIRWTGRHLEIASVSATHVMAAMTVVMSSMVVVKNR